MATKGYLDYGYDQNRDSIFNFNDLGRTILSSPINQNNFMYLSGYPLNFVGFKANPQTMAGQDSLEGGIRRIMQPGAPGDQFLGNAGNIDGVIDCNEQDGGNRGSRQNFSIDIDGDGTALRFGQHGGNSCVTGVNTIGSPRTYKIAKRVLIQIGHFQPHYNQCGEMLDPPEEYTVRVFDEDGFHDIPIQARHGGLGIAGGRYSASRSNNPGACGVPDSVPDVASPNDFVVGMTNLDLCIYITKTDIPDTVPTLKLLHPDWVDKYMNEETNPNTAQSERLAVLIDQHVRPMIVSVRTRSGINPGSFTTTRYDFVNESFTNYNEINITVPSPHHRRFSFSITSFKESQPNPYSGVFSTEYFTKGSNNTFFNITKNSIPFEEGLNTITLQHTTYVPNEKALEDVRYDFRDACVKMSRFDSTNSTEGSGDLVLGDSGSCIIVALGDGTFGLLAIKGTPGVGVTPWFEYGFMEGLDYLTESYGLTEDQKPVYVTEENYPFEEYTTTILDRPSLGYKIYKSVISENGPWYDITNQIFVSREIYHNENTDGVRCIDPTVPCYTTHETFTDEYVVEGNTYYYYVTSLDLDSNNSVVESSPSNVAILQIPYNSEWSDDRKLFVSHSASATDAAISVAPANQVNLQIPDAGNRSTEHTIMEGWRGGDYQNSVPFFGNLTSAGVYPEGGLFPRPQYLTNPTFLRMDGGNVGNSGIYECPLPIESHSFPYAMSLPYDDFDPSQLNQSNYVLKIFAASDQDMDAFRNNVGVLNLSRYDDEDFYQPYYHSNIKPAFTTFPNLSIVRMNPAGYGNHRNVYGEDWETSNTGQITGNSSTYIGYYVGKYLESDLTATNLSEVTLKDSSVSANFDKLEYLNVPSLSNLQYLDVSNNELYVIEFNNSFIIPTTIQTLNISNNNIGSNATNAGGKWLLDSNVPQPALRDVLYSINSSELTNLNFSKNNNLQVVLTGSHENLETVRCSESRGMQAGLDALLPNLRTYIAENSTGSSVFFKDTSLLRTVNVKGSSIRTISVKDRDICSGFASLRTIDISNTDVRSLNLRHLGSDIDGWDSRYAGSNAGPITDENQSEPGRFGSLAANIEYVYAQNSNLERLYLPSHNQFPQSSCGNIDGFGNPNVDSELQIVDVSNTRLGVDGGLEYFFSQSVFDPTGYPDTFTFTVNATNIKDQNGNPATLSLTRYNQIINSWSAAGKSISLNVDVS